VLIAASVFVLSCARAQLANNNRRSSNANEPASQANSSQSNSGTAKTSPQIITNTKGTIEVSSVPPGAKVMLVANDQAGASEPESKGVTPTTIGGLEPGKYTVDLEKPGYKFFQKEVVVKQGTVAKVNATLRK
jgi:hypothetical protein